MLMDVVNHGPQRSALDSIDLVIQGASRIDSTLPGVFCGYCAGCRPHECDQLQLIAWLLDLGFDSSGFLFAKFREKSLAEA